MRRKESPISGTDPIGTGAEKMAVCTNTAETRRLLFVQSQTSGNRALEHYLDNQQPPAQPQNEAYQQTRAQTQKEAYQQTRAQTQNEA